jgi:hypothetical protein
LTIVGIGANHVFLIVIELKWQSALDWMLNPCIGFDKVNWIQSTSQKLCILMSSESEFLMRSFDYGGFVVGLSGHASAI